MKSRMRLVLIGAAAFFLLAGCFEITKVNQPKTAKAGTKFTTKMEVKTDGKDDNAHYGIVAVKLPSDWTVLGVRMSGDYGKDQFKVLPSDVPDNDPGGKVDFWQPQLERIWAPGPDYKWVVYQTTKGYKGTKEVAFADIFIDLKPGEKTGQFALDYFVTNAALDFSDPVLYSVSQANAIEVK
jgi:hypothetical protein